jgi:BRCT domain type II-containing protein
VSTQLSLGTSSSFSSLSYPRQQFLSQPPALTALYLTSNIMTPANSNDIVEGPRKRKATARLTDNADPLLPKNKRTKTPTQPKSNATSTFKGTSTVTAARSASSRQKSVDIEDIEDEDRSEDSEDEGPEVTDVDDPNGEEPEESAENELGK